MHAVAPKRRYPKNHQFKSAGERKPRHFSRHFVRVLLPLAALPTVFSPCILVFLQKRLRCRSS